MKVILAGFNVDKSILEKLNKDKKTDSLTPEVISASYARISRDKRPIDKIRKDAIKEVEKARKSNSTIIFKMGHSSIAEHAVFNIDIIDISRYALEEVEKFRLCSYTEKSQRYITLEGSFILPEELKKTKLEKTFIKTINIQNKAYFYFFEKLKKYLLDKFKNPKDKKSLTLLEGLAKEDARYITSLATSSQVGLTSNARNLELMLRRFASNSLIEIQKLQELIYKEIKDIAPSIIRYHKANNYDKNTYNDLKELTNEILKNKLEKKIIASQDIELIDYPKDLDKLVAASLIHTSSNLPFKECKKIVEGLKEKELEEIFKRSFKYMQFYDPVLREFEYAYFIFNIVLSASCFAQLKRHRMTTITCQDYDLDLGYTIPPSIKEIGEEKKFKEIIDITNNTYSLIRKENQKVANYILTNAHRKRILLGVNARELYHISRLREDTHAQWDIRNLTNKMTSKLKEIMPLTFKLICGKDKYNEVYNSFFRE